MNFCYTVGNIQTRLVKSKEELKKALALRYHELILDYNPNNTNPMEIDYDPIDDVCDHLIAINLDTDEVIGTYRLICKKHTDKFITESEYDLHKLKKYNLLEISRAVVKKEYRDGVVIRLLWKSIINYAKACGADYMIGTASFHGIDPVPFAEAFTYLYYKHLSPEEILCKSYEPNYSLQMLDAKDFNIVSAKHNLPPLIKGYLRLGCSIGDGVFIDKYFNSLDVLIVLEIKKISERYLKRFLGCE